MKINMKTQEPVNGESPDKLESLLYERSYTELWADKHNHVMAMLRTIAAIMNVGLSSAILLKVFGVI